MGPDSKLSSIALSGTEVLLGLSYFSEKRTGGQRRHMGKAIEGTGQLIFLVMCSLLWANQRI